MNQLRTYQEQSDVFVINDEGTTLALLLGAAQNSLVMQVSVSPRLSSDFGGNPPVIER